MCPPRSYVVNLTFPIASSSDAMGVSYAHGRIAIRSREGELTGVKSRLEGCETIILQHVKEGLDVSFRYTVIVSTELTVFPALSRPRNKSFAPDHSVRSSFPANRRSMPSI